MKNYLMKNPRQEKKNHTKSINALDRLRLINTSLISQRKQKILTTSSHIRLAANWLLITQKNSPDMGFSRLYHIVYGWDKSYIETSGYIIPTLFDVATYYNNEKYKESALRAGQWLLSVQRSDGAFTDIDENIPLAFDTGQVLLGLIRLYKETHDRIFIEAAQKAGNWIIGVQDEDGSWTKAGYLHKPHTYYTRVAAAVLALGKITDDWRYNNAAKKNINWAISKQQDNGYFKLCEIKTGEPAFLHTIIYVLEGLLESFKVTGNTYWLESVLKCANQIKRINLERDLILFSQYDSQWNPITFEKCVTGLAQWAWICMHLYEITSIREYFEIACKTIYYLKSKQIQTEGDLKGSLPGSIPIWGRYASLQFPNWSAKFFLDALLKLEKYEMQPWQEQEIWVSSCFKFSRNLVSDDLSAIDFSYLNIIDKVLTPSKNEKLTILDLGCGKGKHIDYLKRQHPLWHLVGVDPISHDRLDDIKKGSACSIPSSNNSFDVVIIIETLQHVSDIHRALQEIKGVLKPGGILIIGERNPISGLGFLKPFLEMANKWMYPWDSPFREKWYFFCTWKKMLKENGFILMGAKNINTPLKNFKFFGLDRYFLLTSKKE